MLLSHKLALLSVFAQSIFSLLGFKSLLVAHESTLAVSKVLLWVYFQTIFSYFSYPTDWLSNTSFLFLSEFLTDNFIDEWWWSIQICMPLAHSSLIVGHFWHRGVLSYLGQKCGLWSGNHPLALSGRAEWETGTHAGRWPASRFTELRRRYSCLWEWVAWVPFWQASGQYKKIATLSTLLSGCYLRSRIVPAWSIELRKKAASRICASPSTR